MKAPREADVLRDCLTWLALHGVFAFRVNSGAFAGVHKGKRRFVRFNSEPGLSDVLGILPDGRFLAVEVKRPGGPGPTPEQLSFLDRVRQLGGVGLVVRSVEDLVQALGQVEVQTPAPSRAKR